MASNDRFANIWKALSDPHRRRLLDLLRAEPQTTGQLAAAFPDLTRFAVMKHLGVLDSAGLVISKKEGRERWNRINASPLQAVVRRWLDPLATDAADALLKLAQIVEHPGESTMPAEKAKTAEAYDLAVELTIDASPEKVWASLTKEIGKWWPKHFYTTENPKSYVVEGKIGGRVYEDWADGAGALWGMVVVWNPPQKMVWACEMYPGFGGPGRSFVTFELAAKGKSTVVRLSDSGISPNAKGHKDSLSSGWLELLGCAKTFTESGK